ncbi:hypothetical protein A1O7_08448 [Cladophialophora yegresii CBS 114405]|uniref:Uncharacterized protein n=1 Tax=Cladophialophora yegresii CBS 114405 TaxID=1182544 RepID=W9VR79_9EURO|nr:uncharacterized protein A1O7_08448 [Cladophialophora yegresii CBS 114405]EXJ55520.1 hypothetical protein A1O7_08448 [Cladophialophora yegresii CBS 114405]
MSLGSFEKGNEDYVVSEATIKSEDEDAAFFGIESEIEPNTKRIRQSRVSSSTNRTTRTPVMATNKYSEAPVTPQLTVSKHRSKLDENLKEILSKYPITAKAMVKSVLHDPQKPLPSIEFSPPPAPTLVASDKKQQIDIDIKSLKPGTVLNFPAKRQPQIIYVSQKHTLDPERFSSPVTVTSSLSSSHDSAGRMLKQNLADPARQIDLRPEDSVSNISVRSVENVSATPPTVTGLVSNTDRFFKGLLTPQS